MSDPNNILFSIENISLRYPKADVMALDGVSFDIYTGKCLGLIGANGAGKTSLISIIAGLVEPSAGKLSFVAQHLSTQQYKRNIGIVPQEIALYENLTGVENLKYFGAMYNVPPAQLNAIIGERLSEFGLHDKANDLVSSYSGGMKRRLNILAGILHDPKLIILDEPMVGVDVRSRNVILSVFKNLRNNGASIVYTSHHMKEVEELCDQIVVLEKGAVVAKGNPASLLANEDDCADLYDLFCKLTAGES